MQDKHLSSAGQHKDWISEQWEKFMFTDECIFGGTESSGMYNEKTVI